MGIRSNYISTSHETDFHTPPFDFYAIVLPALLYG